MTSRSRRWQKEGLPIEKKVLTWSDVEGLVQRLVSRISDPRTYDAILCVTRGGMIPACLISEALNIRNIMAAAVMFPEGLGQKNKRPFFWQFPEDELLRGKRVLVVDDVWSDGRIVMAVKVRIIAAGGRPEVAVLHYRPAESDYPNDQPDFTAAVTQEWIIYPWDLAGQAGN